MLSSLLVCLAAGEGFLRFFYPKYEYAADSEYDLDSRRIWARQPNAVWGDRAHPDTGVRHAVMHNNLAMRQHRDFSADDISVGVNIGFFGDSYTENLRLPSQYSFTEVLDYLLAPLGTEETKASTRRTSAASAAKSDRLLGRLGLGRKGGAVGDGFRGARFNVLNLGVEGYGPDQAFLYYEHFRHAPDLDVVFYVFCHNDLRGIYETGLFHLDEGGAVTRNPAIEPRATWVSLLSGFHMTYLVVDGLRRLAILAGDPSEDLAAGFLEAGERVNAKLRERREDKKGDAEAMAIEADIGDGTPDSESAKEAVVIFQSLLRTWQHTVQERGGQFVVAILPSPFDHRMAAPIPRQKVQTVDLFECFNEHVADYSYRRDAKFANDTHWNEQGNLLAAVCLYRFLERELKLPERSATALLEDLYRYYSAFSGWMPSEQWSKPVTVDPRDSAAIRSKYLANERSERSAG